MSYSSLISQTALDAVKGDVSSVAATMISISLIILVVGILYRIFSR